MTWEEWHVSETTKIHIHVYAQEMFIWKNIANDYGDTRQ